MKWYLKVLRQYADFNGYASRKEYWMFVLFNTLFAISAVILDMVLGIGHYGIGFGLIYRFYVLATLIPGLAVSVRRLHDVGKSGWMMLIIFIPLIGAIWLLVLMLSSSKKNFKQCDLTDDNSDELVCIDNEEIVLNESVDANSILKKHDLIFVLCVVACFMPFFLSDEVFNFYVSYNKAHGMITSFIKFALLATLGEVIGLRMKTGVYNQKGFGILPRAIVWGFLGLTIKLAFVIFATGTPIFLGYLGLEGATDIMKGAFSSEKLLVAFAISACMNLIYAPVMMTLHKITDIHIVDNGGTVGGLLKPIQFSNIFQKLDWGVQWNFVFKKTIPFFWIPAHTFTFLLPPDYQVLFAAALGIVLGVLLAIASLKSAK